MKLEREERGRVVRVQKRPGSVRKVVLMPPEYFLMILVKCKRSNIADSFFFPFSLSTRCHPLLLLLLLLLMNQDLSHQL